MNKKERGYATSGNTGITTISGQVINITIVDDMIHFEKGFKCLKCGNKLDAITKDYKCPICQRDYEEALF